jgi:hypothetical protein
MASPRLMAMRMRMLWLSLAVLFLDEDVGKSLDLGILELYLLQASQLLSSYQPSFSSSISQVFCILGCKKEYGKK